MGSKKALGLLKHFWLLGFVVSTAWADVYVVKDGDTLSSVAHEKIGREVYGAHGSLRKLLALNPGIPDRDLIFPGNKIEIGGPDATEAALSREPAAEEKSPECTPTATPEEAPPSTEHGYLSLLPTFSYSGMESIDSGTGSRGVFLSKLNSGTRLKWGQVWSEQWQSYLQFSYSKVTLGSTGTRTVQGTDQSITGFGAYMSRSLGGRWSLTGMLGTRQELFVRGISTTVLQVDAVPIPRTGLGIEYEAYSSEMYRLHFGAMGTLLFGSATETYTVQTGTAYRGEVGLTQTVSPRWRLDGEIYYERAHQNTTIETHSTAESGFSLGLRYDFSGKTK